jgi:hypothetical protein
VTRGCQLIFIAFSLRRFTRAVDRNDVEEELTEISSEYGKKRLNDERLNELRFEYLHKPMRAKKKGQCIPIVLCKTGIITPEMEYIAIRKPTLGANKRTNQSHAMPTRRK